MSTAPEVSSWFSPIEIESPPEAATEDLAFVRLWRGFMTTRVMIAIVLLLVHGVIYLLTHTTPVWLLVGCVVYLAATLAVRLGLRARPPGSTFDPQWVFTIGVDVVMFSALQVLQPGGIAYAPLFILPVLMAAVLGSSMLALGTAAAVTLLSLLDAWRVSLSAAGDPSAAFVQAGLTGTGLFVMAFLTNHLAARLSREEQAARRSLRAAHAQTQVNELVIESLTDGVMVTDSRGMVRAANPAARQLLGASGGARPVPFALSAESGWRPLVDMARRTFSQRTAQAGDLAIQHSGHSARRVHIRTRLTATGETRADSLCVMFMQDLREMEARLRTEKLAAMGRMSAAVAHEIRNPLAAITQANALLDEDLHEPAQKRLTHMVDQNAQRLARIVEDVLDVSRVHQKLANRPSTPLGLDASTHMICADWHRQNGCGDRLRVLLEAPAIEVPFDIDHLRRVLVNLLDNALRYASREPHAIQVLSRVRAEGLASLHVWSDGAPLDPTVQDHLFEPFFSSESRSSGLGLYICRELCERHGAAIGYERSRRRRGADTPDGNEFFVAFGAVAA